MNVLTMKNIRKSFGDLEVLKDISLSVDKGEGVLRHAIINDLNYRYKRYQYQDASFQEYGYGATQVTIR